jgi:hypothetical protein
VLGLRREVMSIPFMQARGTSAAASSRTAGVVGVGTPEPGAVGVAAGFVGSGRARAMVDVVPDRRVRRTLARIFGCSVFFPVKLASQNIHVDIKNEREEAKLTAEERKGARDVPGELGRTLPRFYTIPITSHWEEDER